MFFPICFFVFLRLAFSDFHIFHSFHIFFQFFQLFSIVPKFHPVGMSKKTASISIMEANGKVFQVLKIRHSTCAQI